MPLEVLRLQRFFLDIRLTDFYKSLKNCFKVIILVGAIVAVPGRIHAQKAPFVKPAPCVQRDLQGFVRESLLHRPPKTKPPKRNSFLVIPTFGSNPASGFMLGAGAQYASRDKRPHSLYSYIQSTLFFTTKKQLLFQVKSNVYAQDDKIFLSGDWRFFIFSQPTYGLSTRAPEGGALDRKYSINGLDVNDDSLVQPMKFNHIRFYQTITKRIKKLPVYVGVGYHLDYYYNIDDLRLDTAANRLLTSHYLYSKRYGFNEKQYVVSGISLNVVGDTRDNLVNPHKGYFYSFNWRVNPTFLGSYKNSTMLGLEWRSFYPVSKNDDRKILGVWLMGNFSPAGQLPYLALPALGYDQRGKQGRGYTQGRFRGPNMIYAETEYRFPLSKCGGIFGGVVFANLTTADNPDKTVKLFENVAPGFGCGLRIMVDKLSRSNLSVDVGVGRKSFGLYVGISETF